MSWQVTVEDSITVEIDAETGEVLGGNVTEGICGRVMAVVPTFNGYQERANLAYEAFNRLGYDQSSYIPVSWRINQSDIDWVLSRTDLYALYLNCHGWITDGVSVLADTGNINTANWHIYSNNNYGIWRFVYLDSCKTSANNNFATAFQATYSGECFIGWNNNVYVTTALDFDRRFFPRLGYMTVYDAVVTSLWESRNAGYNDSSGDICDPGFIGDLNYYGWAW